MAHPDVAVELIKCQLKLGLHKAYQHHMRTLAGLQVLVKPKVGARTTKSFKQHELVLVPMAPHVMCTKEKVPSSAVDFGCRLVDPKGGRLLFYLPNTLDLAGRNGKNKLVVPFWAVRRTPDSKMANMEVATVEVAVSSNVVDKKVDRAVFSILVLRNADDVKEGTGLKLYDQEKLKVHDLVPLEPPKKKQQKQVVHCFQWHVRHVGRTVAALCFGIREKLSPSSSAIA